MKILWLKTGPLHPLDTGGKIRTCNMLRALKAEHEITYLALLPPGTPAKSQAAAAEYSHHQIWIPWRETRKGSAPFFAELAGNLFSPLPYVIAKYRSAAMRERIRALDAARQFDLIICDFLSPAINLPRQCQTPALLFQHNVEALIWKRLFEQARSPLRRNYFQLQWRRLWSFEKAACRRFAGVVGVSPEDCALMQSEYGLDNVLGAVPTGVDVAYFQAVPRAPQPNTIAFLGSMDWMPNIDAVHYFTGEIWPAIKQKNPASRFLIIGRNPPAAVREMAAHDSAIEVTGTVDDVRPFLARAQALVVPLRIGGGTRIKIFEAIAAGLPVVSTTIGMEGLPLRHGEEILVADSAGPFAEATLQLLANREQAEKIAHQARALVQSRFSWESVAAIFSDYCRRAA